MGVRAVTGNRQYLGNPHLEFAYHQLWHEIFGATIIGAAPRPLTPFITILPGLISRPERSGGRVP